MVGVLVYAVATLTKRLHITQRFSMWVRQNPCVGHINFIIHSGGSFYELKNFDHKNPELNTLIARIQSLLLLSLSLKSLSHTLFHFIKLLIHYNDSCECRNFLNGSNDLFVGFICACLKDAQRWLSIIIWCFLCVYLDVFCMEILKERRQKHILFKRWIGWTPKPQPHSIQLN